MAVLGPNRYGKSAVRLVRVRRLENRHEMADLDVAISLEGDFETVHTEGDNAAVLPTDTMKNTVYALARHHPVDSPESFALHLARHFVGRLEHVTAAHVTIAQATWERIDTPDGPHPHAYRKGGEERRKAMVTATRDGVSVHAGVEGLVVLKTTGSAFTGYLRDEYTTLKETTDRIFATAIGGTWAVDEDADFNGAWGRARDALLETFAAHDSLSVQQTLFAMGAAVLERCPEAHDVHLSLPNRHHLLVNLEPFGMDNPNEVFVATTEPHGLIEAMVRRG